MMNLKTLRIELGLTVDEMADKLGLERSTYGQYEAGRREPKFSTLKDMAEYFNVRIDFLIGHTNMREELPDVDDELYFEIKRIRNSRAKKAILVVLKESECYNN